MYLPSIPKSIYGTKVFPTLTNTKKVGSYAERTKRYIYLIFHLNEVQKKAFGILLLKIQTLSFFFNTHPSPGLLLVLGPLGGGTDAFTCLALLCGSRAGADLGRTSGSEDDASPV